jgi:hypothetical protein
LTFPFDADSLKHVPVFERSGANQVSARIGCHLLIPFLEPNMTRPIFPLIVCCGLLAGCGQDGGTPVTLAEAGGVVTFKGSPLADASVTFVPDNGPIATAVTDLSGKFKLMTGSRPGAAVGPCKVTISAYQGGAAPGGDPASSLSGPVTGRDEGQKRAEQMQKMMQKMSKGAGEGGAPEATGSGAKSLIPERYTKSDTSNLKYTVEKDSSKNDFKIDLTE